MDENRKQERGRSLGDRLEETAGKTWEDINEIIDARIELLKMELTVKVALIGAGVVLALLLVIGVGFLITTVAFFTGELFGHIYLGFLLVSVLFLALFVYLTKIKPQLLHQLLQQLLLYINDYKK